ncbi:MAG: acyl carrier protein [Candidatus Omnitrophota bacterium]|nr:MAG: acyl carrier protein [Candidatus Omnitrophota bacterium]
MFDKGKKSKITTVQKEAIFLKIRPIIAKQLGLDENKITLGSNIVQDLGADSLDALEIVMALEDEFGLEILDDDQEKLKTVEDIAIYLAGKNN